MILEKITDRWSDLGDLEHGERPAGRFDGNDQPTNPKQTEPRIKGNQIGNIKARVGHTFGPAGRKRLWKMRRLRKW